MKITLNKILAFFVATMMLTTSCQKDKQEESLNSGKGTVTLKIGGTSFTSGKTNGNVQASNSKKGTTSSPFVQQQEVSFNEDYKVTATLTPINNYQPSLQASKSAEAKSNGSVTTALPIGTEYTITVYEKGNESKPIATKLFKHGVNDTEIKFDLLPGEYTFLASGSINKGKPSENQLRWREDIEVIQDKNLSLNIILQHMFAQANITLNAEGVGNIEQIMYVDIKPTYDVNSINFFSGVISFGRLLGDSYLSNLFTSQAPASIWTSSPVTIKTSATSEGEIHLYNVVINGIMGGQISLLNLTIEEGIKYDLQLKLGAKTEKTFKISGLEFAKGNLKYDRLNDTYSFEESTWNPGHYFFPNYVKPKIGEGNDLKPSAQWNGNNGDPCALVKPLNTWRLPTKAELEILLANNKTFQSSFSYYPGGEGGVFFGTEAHPGSERFNLLYLSLNDYYSNSDHINEFAGKDGRYLLKNGTGYAQLALSLRNSAGGISATGQPRLITAPADMAISIRCIKNK